MSISFISKRKIFYVLSGIAIIIGIVSIVNRGLDYGVEFTGGRSYDVEMSQPVDIKKVKASLAEQFVSADGRKLTPEVKTINNSDYFIKVTTKYRVNDKSEGANEQVDKALEAGLTNLGFKEVITQRKIDPTISANIMRSSVYAIIFSLIIIFLYILIRFKKWQFGLGALLAMLHDVIIVLALFSLFYGVLPFSMEIDQAFIAAILTVVGYSINDTVVVFDRIREYLGIYKKRDTKEVINSALNSTLSRTINTSLSTFVVLLTIFLFGGESIKGFTFGLMVGVIVGTYSSLFIATPSVVDLSKDLTETAQATIKPKAPVVEESV